MHTVVNSEVFMSVFEFVKFHHKYLLISLISDKP